MINPRIHVISRMDHSHVSSIIDILLRETKVVATVRNMNTFSGDRITISCEIIPGYLIRSASKAILFYGRSTILAIEMTDPSLVSFS